MQPDHSSPKAKHYFVFVKNHLLKLMLNYWFVFLIFVPLGLFFGYQFWVVYEHHHPFISAVSRDDKGDALFA